MAQAKRMPVESLRAFGAKPDYRGKLEVARVPIFDQFQKQCSYFDMADISPEFSKGMSAKGQVYTEGNRSRHLAASAADSVRQQVLESGEGRERT